MKKYLLTLTMVSALCFIGKAQVGINQDSPKADLDINAAATPTYAEGLLLPKLDYTADVPSLKTDGVYGDKQDGALINVSGVPANLPEPQPPYTIIDGIRKNGFYYYDAPSKTFVGFNADLGNGSFTPVRYEISAAKSNKSIDWEQIQKTGANYFEFVAPNQGATYFNMPKPSIFANQTIYFRNNSGQPVYFDFDTENDFPKQDVKDPETGEIKKVDNVGMGNGVLTYTVHGTGAYQLYSNGERWIGMSFNDGY